MPKGIYKVPTPVNEPIKNYAPKSAERIELQAMLKELRSKETVSYTHLTLPTKA